MNKFDKQILATPFIAFILVFLCALAVHGWDLSKIQIDLPIIKFYLSMLWTLDIFFITLNLSELINNNKN